MKNPFQQATLTAQNIKVCLYGPAGSGKTVAALTFPRAAVIDSEGGTLLYRGRDGIAPFAVLDAKTMPQLDDAIQFIRTDNGATFDTLVIDPISTFYDVLKDAKQAQKGEITFKDWARINTTMKTLYTKLSNLPVHVVITARQSDVYETQGSDFKRVGVKPESDKAMPHLFDFVIRMQGDHGGIVEKSRGVLTMGANGRLPRVAWDVFAPLANVFSDGKRVEQKTEEDAIKQQAEAMWDDDAVKRLLEKWGAQSVTSADVRAALDVRENWREWTQGYAAADKRVAAWLQEQLDSQPAQAKAS
jgi:hypothetical protein